MIVSGPEHPPPEFFQRVALRPGEELQGFLPNLFSMVIPIQGGKEVQLGLVKYEMVEKPTDLVVTDQRMIGYKFIDVKEGFGPRGVQFFPRFGLNVESAQEIRLKDNRMEVLGTLNDGALSTLYIITGGSREAQGLAQWLEFARKKRQEKLQAARPPAATALPTHERRPGGGWSAPPPAWPPPPPPPPPPG